MNKVVSVTVVNDAWVHGKDAHGSELLRLKTSLVQHQKKAFFSTKKNTKFNWRT